MLVHMLVSYIWPVYRIFIKRYLTPRCKSCGISSNLAPLSVDLICSACISHETQKETQKRAPLSEDAEATMASHFHAVLKEHEGTGTKKYDALVYFSGGKDSTYMLFRLKNEYPRLRILAFTVDNGFMSEVALQNIKAVINNLGIEHMLMTPSKQMYKKLFRYTITHLNAGGTAEAIDVVDGELRFDIGRHLAAQMCIPLIIVGLSREQVWTYGNNADTFETDRTFEFSKRSTVASYPVKEMPFDTTDAPMWWDGTLYKKSDIARILFPLVVWNMTPENIIKAITDAQLLPAKNVNPLLTNHHLILLMAVVDMANLGYSSWEKEFSLMIRTGKTDRSYWTHLFEFLEYTSKTGSFIGKTIDASLLELDLTRKEVGLKY